MKSRSFPVESILGHLQPQNPKISIIEKNLNRLVIKTITQTSKTIKKLLGNNNNNKTKSYFDAGMYRICCQNCSRYHVLHSISFHTFLYRHLELSQTLYNSVCYSYTSYEMTDQFLGFQLQMNSYSRNSNTPY